jgi:hypothetical protein
MKDTNKIHFAAKVPKDLVDRVRLESVRSGRRIQDIVAEALDSAVPHNRVVPVATKGGGSRN